MSLQKHAYTPYMLHINVKLMMQAHALPSQYYWPGQGLDWVNYYLNAREMN